LQIYYNILAALDALKYTDFLKKYNTASKLPKYYEDNPNTENDVRNDRHYFKLHIDPIQAIRYVYRPVRQVKRCICIEMLYVTSGDIFYLRLILLDRKAHSDQTEKHTVIKMYLLTILFVVVGNQLFVLVTSNLPLHMVMLMSLLMCGQPSWICVQMAREHNAEVIL
jgi:hypothetical protein